MIDIDGAMGEGGGQVLRSCLSLSLITGQTFKISNIRMGRKKPGLRAQHLASVKIAAEVSRANVEGAELNSTSLSFSPKSIKPGNYRCDIGTAGSITLLMQSLLLPSVFSGKKISFHITGGTDVKWSQPYDYFKFVFLAQMKRYADVEVNLFKRGYYPKGGGDVKISVNGKFTVQDELPSVLSIEQKKLLQIKGVSHASIDLENARVAERQAESARLALDELGVPFNVKNEYSNSFSPGSGITLWAVFGDEEIDFENPIVLGADSLGERGKKSEVVGKEAGDALIDVVDSGAGVDMHLADQLIPFMALAGGVIKVSDVSNHVKSNIYVAEKFLNAKFSIKDNVISCEK